MSLTTSALGSRTFQALSKTEKAKKAGQVEKLQRLSRRAEFGRQVVAAVEAQGKRLPPGQAGAKIIDDLFIRQEEQTKMVAAGAPQDTRQNGDGNKVEVKKVKKRKTGTILTSPLGVTQKQQRTYSKTLLGQ